MVDFVLSRLVGIVRVANTTTDLMLQSDIH